MASAAEGSSYPTQYPPIAQSHSTLHTPMQSTKGAVASLNALKKDTENFLKCHKYQHGSGYRASWYRPSLEQFSSMTFEEYIRVNILGVPLAGFEAQDPYSDDDNNDDDGANHQQGQDANNKTSQAAENSSETLLYTTRNNKRTSRLNTLLISNLDSNSKTRSRINPTKYSDGIAKITPPKGFLESESSSAADHVMNDGSSWQEGTHLGDMIIPSPIKQMISGIGGVYEFTMLELPSMTVAKYRTLAEQYKQRQVHSRSRVRAGAQTATQGQQSSTSLEEKEDSDEQLDELARFYWRRLGPTMESSVYGADMAGTLFRGDKACGWNVAKLDTCLQLLKADQSGEAEILGVTSPYLYFGMWASSFAAHKEDMNLCSINYLHAGAPKYWYSIAAEDTERFETLMASYFFDASRSCSEFMRHKRYLLSPAILNKSGITYTTQIQRAGDFIITFPGCYHFGFNTGFNVAESTNFAVPEWVPLGEKANICLCHPDSVRIDASRFTALLNRYEEGNDPHKQGKKMSYIEWAKAEDRRRKDAVTSSPLQVCKSATVVQSQGFIVDVYKMSTDCQVGVDDSNFSKKKRKKNIESDRRLARICGKASFIKGTSVICLLPSLNKELKYFSGVIEKRLEQSLRIHFDGVSRKNDMWIPVDSKNLFLDGGSVTS